MTDNSIYKDFFQELKKLIIDLDLLGRHFEYKDKLGWCTEEEVEKLEEEIGKLPLAYREYLLSIGKNYLFLYFDAENYFWESREYRKKLADKILTERGLSKTNNRFKKKYFEIGHGRMDQYFAYIYLDEDDPLIWIVTDYAGEKISHIGKFTDFILKGFNFSLIHKTTDMQWGLTQEELAKHPNYIRDKFSEFNKNLDIVNNYIKSRKNTNNKLILELYESFEWYYKEYKGDEEKSEEQKPEEEKPEKEKPTSKSKINVIVLLLLFFVMILILLKYIGSI